MPTLHPMLPKLTRRDIVLRDTTRGWMVEDSVGQAICTTLGSMAEARLVGRTFVPALGKVWVRHRNGWALLDDD